MVANPEDRLSRDVAYMMSIVLYTRWFWKSYHLWLVIRAAAWQNQQYGLCAQRRRWSAWASAQSDQSWLFTLWIAKDPRFLHVDREDSYQTRPMSRLIWVFSGHTGHFVGFVMLRFILWLAFMWSGSAKTVPPWTLSWENLSLGFTTRVHSNQPAQPQKLGRCLKFRI